MLKLERDIFDDIKPDAEARVDAPHADGVSGGDGNGPAFEEPGLRRCRWSGAALTVYGRTRSRGVRWRILRRLLRAEGGRYWSASGREVLARHHGVHVGAFTYGPFFPPGGDDLPRGTRFGRYGSIARGLRVIDSSHPTDELTSHPFFYDSKHGFVPETRVEVTPLVVGHDVWVGANVTVLPGVGRIGHGAIVGAGAVVTKAVPAYAVVAGVPARRINWRFPEPLRRRLLRSRWWLRNPDELARHLPAMTRPLDESHPLLAEAEGGGR